MTGSVIEVSGEGAGELALDESHLVARAMRATFGQMGVRSPALRLSCTNRIPHARGLGSSSAAIVGGIALARALVVDGRERMDDEACVRSSRSPWRGIPTTSPPPSIGGFVISGADRLGRVGRSVAGASVGPRGRLRPAIRAWPPRSRVACCRNASRTPTPRPTPAGPPSWSPPSRPLPQRLHRATEDFLHQDYRRPAMPDSLDLRRPASRPTATRPSSRAPARRCSCSPPTTLDLAAYTPTAGGPTGRCPSASEAGPHRLTRSFDVPSAADLRARTRSAAGLGARECRPTRPC